MILAATEDGIRDVERGGVTFGDRDVTHLVGAAGGLWAIADRQQVLHAAAGETWRPVGRIEGPAARCVLPPAGNKRRYGGEVIRVSCVAESKQNCDSENDPDRCAVGGCRDSLVEAEHQITSGQAATE